MQDGPRTCQPHVPAHTHHVHDLRWGAEGTLRAWAYWRTRCFSLARTYAPPTAPSKRRNQFTPVAISSADQRSRASRESSVTLRDKGATGRSPDRTGEHRHDQRRIRKLENRKSPRHRLTSISPDVGRRRIVCRVGVARGSCGQGSGGGADHAVAIAISQSQFGKGAHALRDDCLARGAHRLQRIDDLERLRRPHRGYSLPTTHNPGRVSDHTWSDTPHYRSIGQDRDLVDDRHRSGRGRPSSRAARHDGARCWGASALLLIWRQVRSARSALLSGIVSFDRDRCRAPIADHPASCPRRTGRRPARSQATPVGDVDVAALRRYAPDRGRRGG